LKLRLKLTPSFMHHNQIRPDVVDLSWRKAPEYPAQNPAKPYRVDAS
jgi:hypothetical protein